MALYYSLPVYRDTYRLILLLFKLTKEFSREYKYTLGQDIKHDTMQLVRHIYRANKGEGRKEHLQEFADDFELVKLQIRLCQDLRLISPKQFSEVVLLMDTIGKQISGWSRLS
ncbi:four helix bundle protein [Bacteroides sp. 519]|uniref:four helix bundle protein n=1 Tax=Bacteroides sp. 519 TaxID=2302937 RepID=UPI0013D15A19|nr:four helix bundle protein [Bacteroides sp. 519]NDV56926.1 four helix bundle protein [Bacteroides sp. 519]